MIAKILRLATLGIFLSIAGCADIASLLSTPTPVPVTQTTATSQPVELTATSAIPSIEARVLRIWLPPRFDPNLESASAQLLKQRLSDYEEMHPGLKIEVRIKAETGDTGLLNSLAVTSNAAPSALPDLIALPRTDLDSAATRSLLHPIDGLSTLLDDPNWYPYARDLGHIQNIGYGLPFAGDALVMVLQQPETTISTWEDLFLLEEPFIFPAGDPQGLFPLYLYLSAGGKINSEPGSPALEEEPLQQTLTLLKAGLDANVFSTSLLEMDTFEEAFQAYRTGPARAVVAWSANRQLNENEVMQPLPGLDASSTFADGWLWALAGTSPENQQLATELAEYLMEADFLSAWTQAAGYLPTQISREHALHEVLESAQEFPSKEALNLLAPILNQAVSRVLNGEPVEVVVRSVMEQVK